jgi:hypothetical protein
MSNDISEVIRSSVIPYTVYLEYKCLNCEKDGVKTNWVIELYDKKLWLQNNKGFYRNRGALGHRWEN